jgi:hypothetical protein
MGPAFLSLISLYRLLGEYFNIFSDDESRAHDSYLSIHSSP